MADKNDFVDLTAANQGSVQLTLNLDDDPEYNALIDLPAGEYVAQITKVRAYPAKEGKEFGQIIVNMEVADDEYAGVPVTDYVSLSPKAAFRLKQYLKALGIKVAKGQPLDMDFQQNWEGQYVKLVVVYELYNDEEQMRIKRVSAAGS